MTDPPLSKAYRIVMYSKPIADDKCGSVRGHLPVTSVTERSRHPHSSEDIALSPLLPFRMPHGRILIH